MKKNEILISNIIVVFISFYIGHALYFSFVILFYNIKTSILFLYLGSSLVYNSLIYFGLIIMLDKFVYEKTGEILRKLNLANIISLLRITSLPAIFILLLFITDYPILPVFLPYVILVFITDFVDGFIARLLNEITKIGKYIDSTSDYLILLSVSMLFTVYKLIPLWFFILIFIRLSSYPVGMIMISIIEKKLIYDVSFLGKLSIFMTMFLYAYELVSLLGIRTLNTLKPYVEYLVGLIIIISFFEKIFAINKQIKKLNQEKQSERN